MPDSKQTPAIRFKGFTDPWEQRKLGEMTDILSGSRVRKGEWRSSGVPFYRSSDVMAAFNGTDNEKAFISEELYRQLTTVSATLSQGDLLVTGGGSVGTPYIVPNDQPLYAKDADLIWIKKCKSLVPRFLFTYFVSPVFRKYIESISHVGTIAHYTIEQVKDTPVFSPSVDEQRQIGAFFQQLDNLITLHQRKCDKLVVLKKSMLEKMFPKPDCDVPEIRFAGFTNPWEQRKLGEVADSLVGYPFESKHFVSSGYLLVRGMNVKRGYLDDSVELAEYWPTAQGVEDYLLEDGDIVIQMDGALIGKSYARVTSANLPALLVQRVTRIRSKNNSLDFIYQSIQRNFLPYINKSKTETAVPHLSLDDIKGLDVCMPVLAEQRQIGSCFQQLDSLITLHQRKLSALKNIKKSLLEKMFV